MPPHELTYADVFIRPARSAVASRHEVDLTTGDRSGTTVPVIAANMTSVSGRRMAETLARRGALAVLPQDLPPGTAAEAVAWVKSRHPRYETPVVVPVDTAPEAAAGSMERRAHRCAVVVDGDTPVGVLTEEAARAGRAARSVAELMDRDPLTLADGTDPLAGYEALHAAQRQVALVLAADGSLTGILTPAGAVRASIYRPALDAGGRLRVAAALGVNGDLEIAVKQLVSAGVDLLVLDTAHGHQDRVIAAMRTLRELAPDIPLAAGNVVTAAGVADLVRSGADIVKVGVGPGAMCTTRMMTGVGRPQFSAVLECAAQAGELGATVWADGGCRHPRDVVLALAAGASAVMVGSLLAGTHESPGPARRDEHGRLYKDHFGMASRRAVTARTAGEPALVRARKAFFEEGVSGGRRYLDPARPGAEDLLDVITSGIRSACAYVGARTLPEFRENVVLGVQSPAGFAEGEPLRAV
nr:GuaB1 family IMP dehydrogenase-related protein [Actinoplanes teichomyceticus]